MHESLRNSTGKMTQAFFIVSLNALTCYFMGGYFVTYLQTVAKMSQTASRLSNTTGLLAFFRFTGAAISYNLSCAIFVGTAPFIGTYLVKSTGNPASPGYYMAIVAVVVFLASWTVHETARRDLNHH